jgi:hypothetical protein
MMRDWTIRQVGAPEALKAAVAAIYFNDSSDYEAALWAVVRELCPQMAELLEANPSGAYHQADAFAARTSGVLPAEAQSSEPMTPTPYGLAGIEGDAIVIRLTADACAFAFANDPQAREPRPPVTNKRQFLRDTLNELTAEREDGSTPLTDMLDRAMVKAMENGSDALDHDATSGVPEPFPCSCATGAGVYCYHHKRHATEADAQAASNAGVGGSDGR